MSARFQIIAQWPLSRYSRFWFLFLKFLTFSKHIYCGICLDINECIEEPRAVCSKNASCVNLLGSYECKCLDRYEGDPYREGCRPIPPPLRGCRADSDCGLTKKCESITGECYG